jgi:uncharacterized membrane protein
MSAAGEERLNAYLRQVRRELGGLPRREADEVIDELRSHVLDRVTDRTKAGTIEAALNALGPPKDVARTNIALRAVSRIEAGRSPWRVLQTAALLARLSSKALAVLAISLGGYAVAAYAFSLAVLKLFIPGRVGVWHIPNSADPLTYSIGRIIPPQGAHELLGWWIIPVTSGLGAIAALLTWRFGLASVRAIAQSWNRKGRT